MRGQRYDLMTESSLNKQIALSKILTYIFSDQNIFIDKGFRKLLRTNPRGYVHCDDLITQPILEEYFKNIEVVNNNQKGLFIKTAVQNGCGELYYHLGRVRRVVPFNMEKFKKMKPICIERITSPISIEDVRDFFGQHVFALNHKIEKQSSKEDILIYSQNYRENLSEISSKKPPFFIMDYDEFSKQYDLSDRMRQKKMRAVQRPIQMPKKMIEEEQMYHYQDGLEDYPHKFKKGPMKYMKGNLQQQQKQFVAIGREPNREFNQLLVNLLQNRTFIDQRIHY